MGFRAAEVRDHNKTKEMVASLIAELDAAVKENYQLIKVLESKDEDQNSSEQTKIRQLTQDLESS